MTSLASDDGPVLSDGVVTLRRHRPSDVDAVLEQSRDPDTVRWTRIPVPYTRAHAVDFVTRTADWATGTTRTLAIETEGRYAGAVELRLDGHGGAEVGFVLSRWARGRGLMARAVRLALTWGFDTQGLTVVHWHAHVGNWASRRVAWACGFRHEGTVRALLVCRGERRDAWVASLRRGEPMAPAQRWLSAPVVTGRAVVLRPWRERDAERVVAACSDPLSQRWLPQLPAPYGVCDALAFLRSREEEHAAGRGVFWCVADPGDDRCLAALSLLLESRSPDAAEVGYWAHPDARGRGVVTEAVRLAARHAAVAEDDGGLGLHRLVLRAAAGNTASRRVAERAGFTEVGRELEAERHRDGSREDFVRYELLTRDVAVG